MNRSLLTSNRQNWETPDDLFKVLDDEFHFTLDAAASDQNAKCKLYYTAKDDSLRQKWGVTFCNPPYGKQIKKWVKKGYEEAMAGSTVVMLIPARTDTEWFHKYCLKGDIRFLKGRLRFKGAQYNAPFPSMVMVFKKN